MRAEEYRGRVPIDPIKRVVDEAVERQLRRHAGGVDGVIPENPSAKLAAPLRAVAEEIAGYGHRNVDSVYRLLYRVRFKHEINRAGEAYEVTSIRFETADLILCALDREYLWYCDPELNAAYERTLRPYEKRPVAA